DEVRPSRMSPGETGSSEHGAVHLDPPQIEPREVNTRQIGRSEVGTAALTASRLHIQPMGGEESLDLVTRQRPNGVLSRKVDSSKRRSWPIRFCHKAAFNNAPRHCFSLHPDRTIFVPRHGVIFWTFPLRVVVVYVGVSWPRSSVRHLIGPFFAPTAAT